MNMVMGVGKTRFKKSPETARVGKSSHSLRVHERRWEDIRISSALYILLPKLDVLDWGSVNRVSYRRLSSE